VCEQAFDLLIEEQNHPQIENSMLGECYSMLHEELKSLKPHATPKNS